MTHVLIKNGTVAAYPYSPGQLLADNPGTSFPNDIPDATLASWGVYPVEATTAPSPSPTQRLRERKPIYVGGKWTQRWELVDLSADELSNKRAQALRALRQERNDKLRDTDFTQLADSPVDKAAWAQYRQALRDLPNVTPDPLNPVWPPAPTA